MSGRNLTVKDALKRVAEMGCEYTYNDGHYRVTLNGVLMGGLPSTPSSHRTLICQVNKIRARISLYRETGRTW